MDRRDFFRFRKGEDFPLRPPYSQTDFSECLTCKTFACENVCEESIIKIVDKQPIINFSESGCTYCEECVKNCEKSVLSLLNPKKIQGKIILDVLSCLAWQGTICSSCKDICLDKAINFLGMLRPEIDLEKCSNCGFCVSVCPNSAITIK
jgi:ferredoxin-type protein NapF